VELGRFEITIWDLEGRGMAELVPAGIWMTICRLIAAKRASRVSEKGQVLSQLRKD